MGKGHRLLALWILHRSGRPWQRQEFAASISPPRHRLLGSMGVAQLLVQGAKNSKVFLRDVRAPPFRESRKAWAEYRKREARRARRFRKGIMGFGCRGDAHKISSLPPLHAFEKAREAYFGAGEALEEPSGKGGSEPIYFPSKAQKEAPAEQDVAAAKACAVQAVSEKAATAKGSRCRRGRRGGSCWQGGQGTNSDSGACLC